MSGWRMLFKKSTSVYKNKTDCPPNDILKPSKPSAKTSKIKAIIREKQNLRGFTDNPNRKSEQANKAHSLQSVFQADFHEIKKPLYLAYAGLFLSLPFFFIFLNNRNPAVLVVILAGVGLLGLALAMSVTALSVAIFTDKDGFAHILAKGSFSDTGAKIVSSYEIYRHINSFRRLKTPFVRLDVKLEDGTVLNFAGIAEQGMPFKEYTNKKSDGAEDYRAINGSKAIASMEEILKLAKYYKTKD